MGRRRGVNVRQRQSADRQTSGKDPSPVSNNTCTQQHLNMSRHLSGRTSMHSPVTLYGKSLSKSSNAPRDTVISGPHRIVIAIAALAHTVVPNEGKQLTPLACNSVNDLQAMNEETNFVYVTTRGKDCTFVFEGPPEAQLDIKVHSLSTEGPAKNACKNPPVRLYTYSTKNRLRQLEQVLCADDDSVRTVTDTNTAIISSTLRYGSFFVRVRPLSSLTSTVLVDRTKPQSNLFVTQRRSNASMRRRSDLFRLAPDFSESTAIDGMFPPDLQSIDFFGAINQFEIPLRFRAQPQGFVPSAYYQTPGIPRPTDSYGAPVTAGPIFWGAYPGHPGLQVDITSTHRPVELVSANQTADGSGMSTAFTGYPETTPTAEGTTGSTRPTEPTTTIESTRYTEPLTSPTEQTTQTAAPPATAPEKITEESSSSETPNVSATISNSPSPSETFIETEVLSKEEARQVRDGDNTGYLIVI